MESRVFVGQGSHHDDVQEVNAKGKSDEGLRMGWSGVEQEQNMDLGNAEQETSVIMTKKIKEMTAVGSLFKSL